jgi:hypothetical protein
MTKAAPRSENGLVRSVELRGLEPSYLVPRAHGSALDRADCQRRAKSDPLAAGGFHGLSQHSW